MEITWQIAFTLSVLACSTGIMIVVRTAPEIILFWALCVLIMAGIIEPKAAFSEGFGNPALVTLGALYVVAEGLRQTGAIYLMMRPLIGVSNNLLITQLRLLIPASFMSAVLNNTPVLMMLMPVADDICRKSKISVSRLLMPLSFATIMGGTITVIGTSTTVVLNDKLLQYTGKGMGLFELAKIGIPITILGITYLVVTSRWLLLDRKPAYSQIANPREYTIEMLVEEGAALVGKSIEAAGLRHLPGLYLMEIERQGEILSAVSPQEKLQEKDRLIFVGVVESMVDLQKIRGLKPATEQVFKVDSPRHDRCLIEAVISNTCSMVGATIRETQFRTRFNAAIIAVSRDGRRLEQKIGDVVLQVGDTLLIEAHPSFVDLQRNSREFYLVSRIEDSTPPQHEKGWVAIVIMLGMIFGAMYERIGMMTAALLASGLLVITKCVRVQDVRRVIDWPVLLMIGAGLGLGEALHQSHTDLYVAGGLIAAVGDRPFTAMAIIFGVTMVFSNLITAKAAATLILPIALAAAGSLTLDGKGPLDPTPFAVAVMISAACSFATPIGFQTNMMVYGPGGYRYSDFLRVGGPLSLLIWAMSVILIPLLWPFKIAETAVAP